MFRKTLFALSLGIGLGAAQAAFAWDHDDRHENSHFWNFWSGKEGGWTDHGGRGRAPSPEVDMAMGLLVTGGVVAFLRRKKGSRG